MNFWTEAKIIGDCGGELGEGVQSIAWPYPPTYMSTYLPTYQEVGLYGRFCFPDEDSGLKVALDPRPCRMWVLISLAIWGFVPNAKTVIAPEKLS